MATTKKEDKDVIGIAKGSGAKRTTRKPAARKTARKPAAKKPVENKLTAEQERDLKAKQKVEELLQDVDLSPKKEELLELVEDEKQEPKGVEWLEEQLEILVKRNKELEAENQQLKESGVVPNDEVRDAVVRLFDELQGNYLKMGQHPTIPNRGNFTIFTPGFLTRMIKFFPFLNDYKKY
jgi:hypothetical protein